MVKDPRWISGIKLASDADLLYHDAQFSSKEYQNKLGWGHSSIDDAALFGSLAGVKHMLFAHHDPSHTRQDLTNLIHRFQNELFLSLLIVEMAVEGTEIDL